MFARLLIISLCALTLFGCSQRSLEKEMISFDRTLIPALYYTSNGSAEAARTAVTALADSWTAFSNHYYNFRPEDNEWKNTFDLVGQRIDAADKLIRIEGDLGGANAELGAVNDMLFKLRRRKHIKYYMDHMIQFRQPLEAVFMIASRKDASQLSDEDLRNLKWLIIEQQNVWGTIAKAEFNSSLFGFDSEKMAQMKRYIKAQKEILAKLRQAVEKKDRALLAMGIKYLKPNYNGLYRMFGDFGQRP